MAVKIRLARHGARKKAHYRIVAADVRTPRDGRFLEILGTYDPNADPAVIAIKGERLKHWLGNGALPTKTVAELIRKSGVLTEPAQAAEGQAQ
jgi:small subunit ribosomal protein S16